VGCIAIAWGFLILPFTSMTAKSHARDLGDLSYGLYLLHPLTLPVAQVMLAMVPFGWLPVTLSWGPLSVASLAFGLASVAAVLCFHRIERPCMRFGRRLAPDP
jgi:peptidoglycan/LPS O-acetylase OafA/YrhL